MVNGTKKILERVQKAREETTPQKQFGKEKYLSIQLPKGQKSGKKRVRILPPKSEDDEIVSTVYYHTIYVNGYFMRLYDPENNDGKYSPLNEIRRGLYENGDEDSKKLASQYNPRLHYIFKVIDRDAPEDGPKFWRFAHNKKGEGIMDKLEEVLDETGDVTDPDNGRDIILGLNTDNSGITKIANIRCSDICPLSEDEQEREDWIYDEWTWKDVYKIHSVDYLEVVAKGHTPTYDKLQGKYVSKEERQGESEDQIEEKKSVDTKPSTDATDTSNILKTKSERAQEEAPSITSEKSESQGTSYAEKSNSTEEDQTNREESSQDTEQEEEPNDDELPF